MAPLRLNLYWCETDDHHEDWFVVAQQLGEAIAFFRDYEGYGDDDVSAKFILELPDSQQDEENIGYPDHSVLEACGATFVHTETPRVVDLQGTRYAEGMLELQVLQKTDDAFEQQGRGRPNRTQRSKPPS